jgi:hypothetical protein
MTKRTSLGLTVGVLGLVAAALVAILGKGLIAIWVAFFACAILIRGIGDLLRDRASSTSAMAVSYWYAAAFAALASTALAIYGLALLLGVVSVRFGDNVAVGVFSLVAASAGFFASVVAAKHARHDS